MPRAKRSPVRDATLSYVLEVEAWDWSLHFGLAYRKDSDGPYSEYRHLHLSGRLLRPRSVKADAAQCTLLPDRRLNEGHRERDEPKAVGSVSLRRGSFDALLSIPADALPPVLTMMASGRLRYVYMHGDRMRYGRALIRSFYITTTIDEDDLPEE